MLCVHVYTVAFVLRVMAGCEVMCADAERQRICALALLRFCMHSLLFERAESRAERSCESGIRETRVWPEKLSVVMLQESSWQLTLIRRCRRG